MSICPLLPVQTFQTKEYKIFQTFVSGILLKNHSTENLEIIHFGFEGAKWAR